MALIGQIRGLLMMTDPPLVMLDVGGLGYEVQAPSSVFGKMPHIGDEVTLITHHLVKEDSHTLYGFLSWEDRDLFRHLLRVSGVGAKVALTILSGFDAPAFVRVVVNADVESLVRLPGIGKKTAQRLVMELKDKMAKFGGATASLTAGHLAASGSALDATPDQEARVALAALGYKPFEVDRMLAGLETQQLGTEEIIKLALRAR